MKIRHVPRRDSGQLQPLVRLPLRVHHARIGLEIGLDNCPYVPTCFTTYQKDEHTTDVHVTLLKYYIDSKWWLMERFDWRIKTPCCCTVGVPR